MTPARSRRRAITRFAASGASEAGTDELAVEAPLEVRIRGRSVTVTMRTPGHDEELVAGLLFTEGIIAGADDLRAVAPCPREESIDAVNVVLDPRCADALERLERFTVSASSSGVCGKRSAAAIAGTGGPAADAPPLAAGATFAAATILALPAALGEAQALFARTGGVHAAALFDHSGRLLAVREDVGRHNAVDKIVGYGVVRRLLPWERHVLLVSGRASFEIVQKALAARIPVVAAVSAPTSLAVDLAERHGQTLIGFLRDGRANVYAGAARITGGAATVTARA
jgi:FdhD protein